MIISEQVDRNFLRFFSNDDSRAYFTNNSELERKLRRNISPSGVVRAKRSRLGSVNELNIPEIKIRSHSCPTVPLSKTTMDLNRLCMVIKQKSSQARHDLYNISTHCTIEILDENQKELIPFVGRTPDAVIADSEMTLMIINKMIDGTDKIKRKFDKHKGERKKKVVKAARTVKYILSDLYNNLILLEAALGRQNFRILKTDFDDRMRDKSLRMALSRCHSKCLLDLKMDSDIPKLAIRERQARNKNFEAIFNDRKDLVILSKKLMNNKLKKKRLGDKKICRLCQNSILASKLLTHSKRCKIIIDLYKTLIETNNWLLEKCKDASKLKNRLGFDTLLKQKDKKRRQEEDRKNSEKNSVKNEEEKEKAKKVDKKVSLRDKRSMFKKRRCITSYQDDSKKETKNNLENQSVKMQSVKSGKSSIKGGSNNQKSDGSDVPTKGTSSKKEELSSFGRNKKKQSKFAMMKQKSESTQPSVPIESKKKETKSSFNRNESPSNASSENTAGDSINVTTTAKPPSIFYSSKNKTVELPQKTLRSSHSHKFSIFMNYSLNKKSSTKNSQSFDQPTMKQSEKSSQSNSGCFADQLGSLMASDNEEENKKTEQEEARKDSNASSDCFADQFGSLMASENEDENDKSISIDQQRVDERQRPERQGSIFKEQSRISIDYSKKMPALDLKEVHRLSSQNFDKESGQSNLSGNYQAVTGVRKEELKDAAYDLDDLFQSEGDEEQENFLDSGSEEDEEEEEQVSESQHEPEREVGVIESDRIIDKKKEDDKLVSESIPQFDSVIDVNDIATEDSIVVEEASHRSPYSNLNGASEIKLTKTTSQNLQPSIPQINILCNSKQALDEEAKERRANNVSFEETLRRSSEIIQQEDVTKLSPKGPPPNFPGNINRIVKFDQMYNSNSEKNIKIKDTSQNPRILKKSSTKMIKETKGKKKNLNKKRADFFKKSKKRESATQYQKQEEEEEEQVIVEEPTEGDFMDELRLLRFAKEFYTQISKYGEELPKNSEGKKIHIDYALNAYLQTVISKGQLVNEVYDFASEFSKKVEERINIIRRIQMYEKEDYKQLYPDKKETNLGHSSISFNQKLKNASINGLKKQGMRSKFASASRSLMKRAIENSSKMKPITPVNKETPKKEAAPVGGGRVFEFMKNKMKLGKKLIKSNIVKEVEEKVEKKKSTRKGMNLAALRRRNKTFVAPEKGKKKKRRKIKG